MRWAFWRRREPAAPHLEPIRIYTTEMVLDARVKPGGQRMTDILQRGGEIAVLPNGADEDDAAAWVTIPTADVLMAVPPPHVSPRELRIVRDQREVRLTVGTYRVVGTAHLRPGLERDVYTRVTHPFLPLTNVSLIRADGSEWTAADVLIINLRWAEFADQ